jgi:hypothetical protein
MGAVRLPHAWREGLALPPVKITKPDRQPVDPDRYRDPTLPHAKGVPQSLNFSYLPHRRSLGGRRPPLHNRKGRLVRDAIADSESFK